MAEIISAAEARETLGNHPPLFDRPPTLPQPRRKELNECPLCGFPGGRQGFLQSFVPIDHPLFGRLIRCPLCWEGHLPRYLEELSGLSGKMLEWTLDSMMRDQGRREAWVAAKKFAKDPTGWLTVWGSYGVGKTYTLAAIVNELRHREKAAMYVVAPDLLDRLRESYDPDAPHAFDSLFIRVRDVPVLALDELGQVRMTAWALEKLFQLLDYRLREAPRLGTVISLHFEPKPTAAPADWPDRARAILSRMYEYPDRVIEMSGGDVRPLIQSQKEEA